MASTAQAKNKPRPLDKLKVKIALARRNWSQGDLANELGVSITTINLTINHNTSSNTNRRIRAALKI